MEKDNSKLTKAIKKRECWKDVTRYEGIYQISDLGKIRSLTREIQSSQGKYIKRGKNLIAWRNNAGYLLITLCKESNKEPTLIHRIVAQAFVPNPDDKPQVNHINGVRDDNRASNLEWCTAKENIEHAVRLGLRGGGEKSPNPKLKKVDVFVIKRACDMGIMHRYIAEHYGVNPSLVSKINHNRVWKVELEEYELQHRCKVHSRNKANS